MYVNLTHTATGMQLLINVEVKHVLSKIKIAKNMDEGPHNKPKS